VPKKSSTLSLADRNAAEGGVAAVDRALSLLDAFSPADPLLTLAELAARTQLHKSTALRMLASLAHAHLVQRHTDGRYGLGAGIARLHRIHAASFSLKAVIMPVLRQLVAHTQESVAFHVRQGDEHRICLHRVDSPRPVRDHMKVGDLLPLDRGAGGRVLQAFAGEEGELYDRIRRELVVVLVGDRLPELAGLAAPVFAADGNLCGALTITMPAERFDANYDRAVMAAARRLTALLGGTYPDAA
jgi:DNA-binding IclR family transcriptional regulator